MPTRLRRELLSQLLVLFYILVYVGLQTQASPAPPATLHPEGKVLPKLPRTICSSLSHKTRRAFPYLSTQHHTCCSKRASRLPCKMKLVFVSFASFWDQVMGFFCLFSGFFWRSTRKFSIFILSTFASCNFQVLSIPVF